MSELRGPTLIALDDAIENLLLVMRKYANDSRGPSIAYLEGLAAVVHTLMRARQLA